MDNHCWLARRLRLNLLDEIIVGVPEFDWVSLDGEKKVF